LEHPHESDRERFAAPRLVDLVKAMDPNRQCSPQLLHLPVEDSPLNYHAGQEEF